MADEPADITITRLTWIDQVLDAVETPRGRLRITLGLGSGLARRAGDPPGVVWAIGDRGPNLKIGPAVDDHGLAHLSGLAGREGAKIMPSPAIGPMLVQLRVEGDTVACLQVLPLRDATGAAFDGLPGPGGDMAAMEPAFDLSGAPLGHSLAGGDTEGVVALADGTFRVADEYGPSILVVAADGVVQARWVPEGEGAGLAGAAYRVEAVLPPLSARRRLNRGFEAVALSPDETRLHVILQSPLAPKDETDDEGWGRARLWTLDARTGAPLAEHFYPFDAPETFRRDALAEPVGPDDLKISEAVSLGGDQLLVLERISRTSKLYRVTLDAPVLTKTLVLSTDDWPEIDADLEGMALLSDRDLLLSTDNDFGVEGRETAFYRVTFAAPLAGGEPV
ncbi:esterase-like activity of phytase family protein [Caulobacter sp. UNC358MFTsu5.1]|uniref:esterase-like activity of phytase family protein n=1 Tax=Caulobacter sp. UNC358MFTsu5.1 TaxID=1449049 RepID=UPI0004A6D654|nr:esterase-like activity of phytase family protein [Caulobacter sp. UNC358MFTsu5.1]